MLKQNDVGKQKTAHEKKSKAHKKKKTCLFHFDFGKCEHEDEGTLAFETFLPTTLRRTSEFIAIWRESVNQRSCLPRDVVRRLLHNLQGLEVEKKSRCCGWITSLTSARIQTRNRWLIEFCKLNVLCTGADNASDSSSLLDSNQHVAPLSCCCACGVMWRSLCSSVAHLMSDVVDLLLP